MKIVVRAIMDSLDQDELKSETGWTSVASTYQFELSPNNMSIPFAAIIYALKDFIDGL
jgi:hypothetical protein